MGLSIQQQMLIEQRVTNQAKSAGVAYLLLIFLGGMGVHRLYLGRTGTGVTMLILFLLGWLTLIIGIGVIILILVGLCVFVDLFLVPGMVEQQKAKIRSELERQMLVNGSDREVDPAPGVPYVQSGPDAVPLPQPTRS